MTGLGALARLAGFGFVVGLVLTYALLRRSAVGRAEARFEAWRATGVRRIRRTAADGLRATAKLAVGQALAPDLLPMSFTAADARFLGHPVHYVVFDGHTEVRDRAASCMREVVFLTLSPPDSPPSPFSELVRECVGDGRVAWLTLRL